jgi:RHS repeat-associated protein
VEGQPTIKLNRQPAFVSLRRGKTSCPPRTAVPVNQGCGIGSFTHRTQFAFGHGGDHSNYVDRECSPVHSSGNPKIELAAGGVRKTMPLPNGMKRCPLIFLALVAALLSGGASGAKAFTKYKADKPLLYGYAGGQLVCSFETNSTLFGGTDTNRVAYYYHEDDLNSSTALSSGGSSGSQIEVNAYYPFGRVMTANPQASFKISRQFTGQVKDDDTGLYYYNARYYDPLLGRFIQADTIIPDLGNPQSYNRYSNCLNNPLSYNDPSGHDPTLSFGVANLTVEQRIIASRAAAPAAIGVGVAMVTAGVATPLLVSAGASTTFAAVGSGMIAGATGDLAAQGTQIGLGQRQSISGQEVAVSSLAGGALNGFAGKLLSPRAAPAGVQANKAAGDAWEAEVVNKQLPITQDNIQPRITIKSSGPSGKNVRLDAVGTDRATGNVRLTDAKASPTARFTPNQTVVYPELQKHGGTVAGAGKPPYSGGTVIPPTKVDVIRKP